MFHTLKERGILGPNRPLDWATEVVQSKIWSLLDVGINITNIYGPEHEKFRRDRDTLQKQVGACLLGANCTSSIDGILGELGWPSMCDRDELNTARFYLRLAYTNPNNLAHKITHKLIDLHANNPASLPQHVRTALDICQEFKLDFVNSTLVREKKKAIQSFTTLAGTRWSNRIGSSHNLKMLWPGKTTLMPPTYITIHPFKGRSLITRLRLGSLQIGPRSKTKASRTKCPACDIKTEETRYHFLLECEATREARISHFSRIHSLHPMNNMTPCQRLRNILLADADQESTTHIHSVGRFIHDAWIARAKATGTLAKEWWLHVL